jgi:hypothetical protein
MVDRVRHCAVPRPSTDDRACGGPAPTLPVVQGWMRAHGRLLGLAFGLKR